MKDIIGKIDNLQRQGVGMNGIILKRSGASWAHGLTHESRVGDLDFAITDVVGEQLEGIGWKKDEHPDTGDTYYRTRGMEAFPVWRSNGTGEPIGFSEARKWAHKEKLSREFGWRMLIDCPRVVRDEKKGRMLKRDPEHVADIEVWLSENPDFLLKCAWARQWRRMDQARDTFSDAVGVLRDPVHALGNVAVISHRLLDRSA